MVQLIIDSGSTKMEWVVLKRKSIIDRGIGNGNNPHVDLKLELPPELVKYEDITHIHYYSAGVTNKKFKSLIKRKLISTFSNAENILIHSDLLAAARASYANEAGIIGILGTGSNIAYYNGIELSQKTPSLGYILGDEGSGFDIGKAILKAFFYNQMSTSDHQLFVQKYDLSKDQLLKSIFNGEKPNKYIANYSKFLIFASSELKNKVLVSVFERFIHARLLPCYRENNSDVMLIGSIANIYQKELQEVLNKYDIHLKSTLKFPMNNLINYHTN